MAGLKRRVARELVGSYLKSNPQATAQQVHQAILSTPFDKQTADRADSQERHQNQASKDKEKPGAGTGPGLTTPADGLLRTHAEPLLSRM